MWPLAVLKGVNINGVIFYKKMYDRFAGQK